MQRSPLMRPNAITRGISSLDIEDMCSKATTDEQRIAISKYALRILDRHNTCSLLLTSHKYHLTKLRDGCLRFISERGEEVLTGPAFRALNEDAVAIILTAGTGLASYVDEMIILDALVGWAEHHLNQRGLPSDSNHVSSVLSSLLYKVELPHLKAPLSPRRRSNSLEDPILLSLLIGEYELNYHCNEKAFVPFME
ncbi:hypothetical protein PROFUN_13776 [Planoprotostelium fungivorum]|uniref:BACK domain-containing protein n=1 Tax=Planoprotostelium fungivorum TaxID=1890364 RepID=A0A2P6MVE1_9EUKA|nr:hypothetical protein PROFUN_15553 [Planoprotostelium fungivorum]PRP78046.1 hypothetical protein PROFUN_13776 [Planoprotostelium fungivorum]